ncbi:MAG: methionyl-tRNA formyltransferase [Acidimicrobiales bacterium]|nr:methionyl-tRNA formyltransferase [Acidimicrobiales bacterium]MCB1014335.1 methionyl-tRNA formyltransferase [Acidimicrobiales bacterium]MCB9371322.1 methionyl-tRNA formyltransferase [Microthrixaceae bacterium]
MTPPPIPPDPRRLVYLGTPALAVAPLQALVDDGREVVLVVTRPDKRRGRGADLQPSPVKAAAQELGIPVSHDVDDVLSVDADLGVVVAFGEILRDHVLDAMPLVNLHFSLLPRWRGAAPVERAILAGDEHTGVCLMEVVPELDAGGVYARTECWIHPDVTLAELRDELVDLGSSLLLDALADGFGPPVPQDGEATYARKIRPEEREIDWSRPTAEIHRQVRVGGAWTTFRGKRLKVHRTRLVEAPPAPGMAVGDVEHAGGEVLVGAGDGPIALVEVQPEGKGRLDAAAWFNGAHWAEGDRLGGAG